ncbi:hypothetical protein ABT348_01635 [Streptomyces olivaceus]|uniref:hypothetical protein n=1 Tax=Streptomyces olivaceus TaxID=47716 RepID=UPI00331D7DE2
MTRPTARMCARCQRTTDEPVLVHEVHAATGRGFNVYACPECAPHYPPTTDPLDILDSAARHRSHLTLRVNKVDADGIAADVDRQVGVHAGGPQRTNPPLVGVPAVHVPEVPPRLPVTT